MLSNCRFRIVLSLFVLTVLSACNTSSMDPLIDERITSMESRIETARQPAAAARSSDPLSVSDSIWVGDKATRLPSGEPLPDEWQRPDSFALRSDTPVTLTQLAALISSQTRIPVRLTGGAEQIGGTAAASSSGPAPTDGSSDASIPANQGMVIAYEGPLSGLLDLISGFFNLNWRYESGNINISRFQTRTFIIDALPGAIGSQEAGAASALASASIDIWADMTRMIETILDGVGTYTASQSSGTILVSTTSDRMELVARYISDENQRLSRQLAVTIDLYTVRVDDEAGYGFNLTAALAQIGDLPPMEFAGPTPTFAGEPGSLTVTLVEPNELAGSEGIVQALATLGKTTRVAQIPLTTLNNRPAVQSIASTRAYLSSVTTTTTGGSDTTSTSSETDEAETSINVTVLPRIMSDGRILLQYALAQSELISLRPFDVGENTVQLPETQELTFSQQVMMKNGSTLVLAGFDRSDADTNATGMGRPLTWMFGGGTSSRQSRQLVVIAITPREIRVARREAS